MDPRTPETPQYSLILASTSRYRKTVLEKLNLVFATASPEVDETPAPGETPCDTAQRLARLKASAIGIPGMNAWVIGSDQVASLNGLALGKPGNEEAAREQLKAMSGQEVLFYTAIALCDSENGQTECEVDISKVTSDICRK